MLGVVTAGNNADTAAMFLFATRNCHDPIDQNLVFHPGHAAGAPAGQAADSYEDLTELFAQWRAFERPPLLDGAPDYTAATNARRHAELAPGSSACRPWTLSAWPIEQQVDWHLVRAEMNGMDFNMRVLRPWQRDPAFYTSVWTYRSDTPDHEGPTHHAIIELWQYAFPLEAEAEARLAAAIALYCTLAGTRRAAT